MISLKVNPISLVISIFFEKNWSSIYSAKPSFKNLLGQVRNACANSWVMAALSRAPFFGREMTLNFPEIFVWVKISFWSS